MAARRDHVYVCDETAGVVDQLDASTGRRLARLDSLQSPHAVAADLNAVYIAENGRGRVLIATTTLWRPDIPVLAREQPDSPIVAARLPVPPIDARISVNVYDQNDLTVRQLACAADGRQPVIWDGRDYLGNWVSPAGIGFTAFACRNSACGTSAASAMRANLRTARRTDVARGAASGATSWTCARSTIRRTATSWCCGPSRRAKAD